MQNDVFDSEKYVLSISESNAMEQFKAPSNKVPANNLPKLAPDKKIVPIQVSF